MSGNKEGDNVSWCGFNICFQFIHRVWLERDSSQPLEIKYPIIVVGVRFKTSKTLAYVQTKTLMFYLKVD